MPEQPTVPPQRKPVSELPTPDQTVSFYTELVGRDDPAYQQNSPMKRGTLYSTIVGANQDVIARFPQLFFLRERKFQLSDQLVLWDWATDEQAHDTYNSTVTYIANNVNYPAFTRVYTIRRELYEQEPTLTIGDPLLGIIAVEIVEAGAGYTYATGRISGDDNITVTFTLTPEGGLLNGIITNTGEDVIADGTSIIIEGDGSGGVARAMIQPSSCVLTSQQKEELQDQDPLQHELVKVTRVYETLPGPFIYTTRFDKDGKLVTTGTRRNITADITDGDVINGGQWTQTWHKATDSFVSEETVESRPIPGNLVVSTKVDEDGAEILTQRQLVDTLTIITSETIVGGVWIKKYGTEVDDSSLVKVHDASWKVSYQVTESRVVPGNAIPYTRIDDDGKVVSGNRTLNDQSLITSAETLVGNVWTHTFKEKVTDLVSWQVTESRAIPGNFIESDRIDEDGFKITVQKQMESAATIAAIADREFITGGTVWSKITSEAISDLVSWKIIESRVIPGNPVFSYKIDGQYEINFIQKILKERNTITPSASEGSGNVTTVEAEAVSDLVANEVTTVKAWLDEADYEISIPNVIPQVFRAQIPTTVTVHVVPGTASMPTLGLHELSHSQKQLTKLFYVERIESFSGSSFSAQNHGVTSRFGGNTTTTNFELAAHGSLTVDTGLMILDSNVTDLGNGDDVKITEEGDGGSWPTITSKFFDEEMQVFNTEDRQVVDPSYTPTNGTYFVEKLQPIDQWKAWRIKSTRTPTAVDDASALVTQIYAPFQFPGWLAATMFGYYVRHSHADLCKQELHTWWQSSVSKPTVSVDEIVMDQPIISTLNSTSTLAYAPECLHDTFTTFGTLVWPATTPDATTYTGTWIGTSRVVKAVVSETEIPNLWKIVTTNVVMR